MNSKIFSEQRLQSLCINQMLLKSLLKIFLFHKEQSSLRSGITFALISGTLSRASWKQNWIKDIRPAPFCEAFWKPSALWPQSADIQTAVDIHCTMWMLASLNGIRDDKRSAQWLTVFYWVSLMHGTMESNNLQLRSHLRYGWPIRVDSH